MKATVKLDWLVETVKKNRENHRKVFLEALDGFKAKAIEEFEKKIALIKAGKIPSMYAQLTVPTDQTRDYDRVISMLTAMADTRETTIELSEDDFAKYALDQWEWKRQWISTSNAYLKNKLEEVDE